MCTNICCALAAGACQCLGAGSITSRWHGTLWILDISKSGCTALISLVSLRPALRWEGFLGHFLNPGREAQSTQEGAVIHCGCWVSGVSGGSRRGLIPCWVLVEEQRLLPDSC